MVLLRYSAFVICLVLNTVTGAQVLAPGIESQPHSSLPQTFSELVTILPSLVHNKQLQFGLYSDAVWAALQRDPNSAFPAIPLLSRNLQDPDQDVEFYTLSILQDLALRSDYVELVTPFSAQLAHLISSGNDKTRSLALLAVAGFRQKAPDALIRSTEQLLLSRPNSERVLLGSAGTLMITRPTDETAQNDVLDAINDPALPVRIRQGLLQTTSFFGVGSKVRENVVRVANTSDDKTWRDIAIAGVDRIGPEALTQIRDRLDTIANDPTESLASHRLAHRALTTLDGR
jgi:hypothetical protein